MNKKELEKIYKMTQTELKTYAEQYLKTKFDNVISEDGFLYAKGSVPVLLVAHMDTVHKESVKDIVYSDNGNKISSPQGIGGDDRNGIAIIFNLVQELKCSVLLCEDEEIGCVGARKFAATDYIKNLDVNYMIEFDRKGNNDAVFYHCGNQDFIDFVEDATNFKFATGSVSDISVLMDPANLSAVNLSSGYYNAHTTSEYVMYDEMLDAVEAAKTLIKEKCDKPFEYVRKTYAAPSSYANFNNRHFPIQDFDENDYYDNLFDRNELAKYALDDKNLELEVVINNEYDVEDVLYAVGDTKAECWMNLFIENPYVCFNDVVDYSFS